MTIEAKFAQILTPTTGAIAAGSAQGVKVGDTVSISNLVTVKDPTTGEILGEVSVVKVKARVESVKERVCVVKVTSSFRQGQRSILKTLTDDPDLSDFKTIMVSPGDHVEFETPDDDVPF